jgi:hypothetical protein
MRMGAGEGCMDTSGFRTRLQSLGLDEAQINASIALAERFEAFVAAQDSPPTADSAWAFSRQLIGEGKNTRANYLALVRYCRFIGNPEMYVALLELVDGGEVDENLYRLAGEKLGSKTRDEAFAGIGVAPYGTPSPEKPAYLQPVIGRLQARLGEAACSEFLSECLRDLPEEDFLTQREEFRRAGSVDAYLRRRKDAFVAELEDCLREGRPFYAQEITEDVIDFVRNEPEMGAGKREGSVIYETKIPYMAQQYLTDTDPILKRYHACHCPWARDAIKNGNVKLAETFCYCSGGFHKKPWEIIFDQLLTVDVLESALRGDVRCRFAIHLPQEEAIDAP